jgi:hypothetical protein
MPDVLVDLFTNVIIMPRRPIATARYDSIDDAEQCCLELLERMLGLRPSWRVGVSSRGQGRRITFPRRVKQEHPPKNGGDALKLPRPCLSCGAQQQRRVAYGDSDARSVGARGQPRLVRV